MHIKIETCDLSFSNIANGNATGIDLPILICRLFDIKEKLSTFITQQNIFCFNRGKAFFIMYIHIFQKGISFKRIKIRFKFAPINSTLSSQGIETVLPCLDLFRDPCIEFLFHRYFVNKCFQVTESIAIDNEFYIMLLFDRLEFPFDMVCIIASFKDEFICVKIIIELRYHIDILFFDIKE